MPDHPWIPSYPEGVTWDAELPTMPVQQILAEAAARYGDKPALSFMGRSISYRQFEQLVDRAAVGLQALGVKPGVHVGLFLPNTLHYPIGLFAVLRAGGTVVNYSPLDVEKVLAHKIDDSQTDLMITLDSPALLPQMQRLLDCTRLKTLIIGDPRDAFDGSAGPRLDDPRQLPFSQLLANDGAPEVHPLGDLREALAVIQYTGGTTGLPKGAMLTHFNLSSACAQYLATSQAVPPSVRFGEERVLVVLPLFHIYSLTVNLLLGVRIGAELVLHPRFDLEMLMTDLVERRISVFAGVPTMYMAMVNHPSAATADLRSLGLCSSGGAPLPIELAARFTELTGCVIGEGWGMTETSPTGTFTPKTGPRHPGSCGIPLPRIELKLISIDDPSRDAAAGEPGELCIAGPNVMKGYWNNPKATADSMTADGFFRTGDVATVDADGFFSIVDRTKDMLLCGGYNVYPRIIEEALYEHPAVREACVIGIPDAYRGQSPKAFVSLKSGAAPFTLDELKLFLEDKLGKHEMVQALEIRTELPKTAVGKLSKRELVDEEAARRTARTASSFQIARNDLRRTRVESIDPAPLAEGQVRLHVDSFSLTSNNITYGAFGDAMHYWEFFPTGDAAWGSLPVWGFANVIESQVEGVAVGERFYGYYPMSTELLLQPTRIGLAGFEDGAAHRSALAAVYNRYTRCSADRAYRADAEAQIAIFRPLFITSFLIDDFLDETDFFGTRTVILSSASSKTAYGLAFCLSQRRGRPTAVKVIALTSPGNLAFTQSLGCYDDVKAYDALDTIDANEPAVFVDFAGNAKLRARLHDHLAATLAYSCSVGGTHVDALGSGKGLPGPKPILFFAPDRIRKRLADWTPAGLQQRLAESWIAFMEPVMEASPPWLKVMRGHGPAAIEAAYRRLLDGTMDPREGYFLSL